MESREQVEKLELSFDELLHVLEQAAALQQAMYDREEGTFDYDRDIVPIYQLYQDYKLEWSPPEGQKISIPQSVGQHPQIQQPEYHNDYPWVYPLLRELEPVVSADKIVADTDGIYAYADYGHKRVVLFSPKDTYHTDPAIIRQLSVS